MSALAVLLRRAWLVGALLLPGIAVAAVVLPAAAAEAPPAAPAGLTAIALDGKVGLAWQPSPGATGYRVYRGATPATATALITATPVTDTRFTDTTAVNAQESSYVVRAVVGDQESTASQVVSATPQALTCSSASAVVRENCFPGTTNWKTTMGVKASNGGVEAFATRSSVNVGESFGLKLTLNKLAQYRVEIYRSGHYGGTQGRLISVIRNLTGVLQPGCESDANLGLVDCSNWPAGPTITTSPDWPSGVYLMRLVREDTGNANEVMIVVRDDSRHSDILYNVPTTTYQAYSNYKGKSLYTSSSSSPNTISGETRAVKVSYDRPYTQPTTGSGRYDWYTRQDVSTVSWLEEQGYDVAYTENVAVHNDGARLRDHRVVMFGSHDEYWSTEMRQAAEQARDAGTSLIFMGANSAYWKIRLDQAGRIITNYKTIQSGPPDPSGDSTSTWRDPSGPNAPENALIGSQYIGDKATSTYSLKVSADEGKHRIWRYTPVNSQAPGASATVGPFIGWEWDARTDNGAEPAGVETVASSPVSGNLVQGNGASYASGNAISHATIYKAASGARVFATGTNYWARGLARNVDGAGEPNATIQQATMNVLADMGVRPVAPATGRQLDPIGAPSVTAVTPAAGAVVETNLTVTATFDREIDPTTLTADSFVMRDPSGHRVAGDVSMDNTTKKATFRPTDEVEPFTQYTVTISTDIAGWAGVKPATPYTWTFATGQGSPPEVRSRTPAVNAVTVPVDTTVTASFSRRLNPATVNGSTFKLVNATTGAAVAATVSYDAAGRMAQLVPNQRLTPSTKYTATLTTGIQAFDGRALAAAVSWSFTTGTTLQITSRSPLPFAGGISPHGVVRVVFSRSLNPNTLTSSTLTLTAPGGAQVPADISYDDITKTATLRPTEPLSLFTTYTARVLAGVRAADDGPLEAPTTWSFTTAISPPPAPGVVDVLPGPLSTGAPIGSVVDVNFDQAIDATTVTTSSFTLTPPGGTPLAATVKYDEANLRATLSPNAPLVPGTTYTARVSTAVQAVTGQPMESDVVWTFDTGDCPCTLNPANTVPTRTGLPVQDGRSGAGPWSLEVGTKIAADVPVDLTALRFYKDAKETGTHVGRIWSTGGTLLAQVTFKNESASGWQQQPLPEPFRMDANTTYVVSIGLNAYYTSSLSVLSKPLISGPLRSVADGLNGVYASASGLFPTLSYKTSNYFMDAVVRYTDKPPRTPAVSSHTPTAGETGVRSGTKVKARFSLPLEAATVDATSFLLRDGAGASVPASVSYDAGRQTATLVPGSPLRKGETYTAELTREIRSDDGTRMASPYIWSFATTRLDAPDVASTSPADGAAHASLSTSVKAVFSTAIDPATVNAQTFTLTGPGGQALPAGVTFDATTNTATLTPSSPLESFVTYTAKLTTGIAGTAGVSMESPYSWQFTTSRCPCQLFPDTMTPAITAASTQGGRSGAGPWSYEMGVRVEVTQPATVLSLRYYRDPNETGSHVGTIWSATGAVLATVPFTSETGGGWQEQALATPLDLVPGETYTVSVNFNDYYSMTNYGLQTAVTSGPLRTIADGRNGVYAYAAGGFPIYSWKSSNYLVDLVVR